MHHDGIRDVQGLWLLAGLMLTEVVASLFTESDVLRAAIVSSIPIVFLFLAVAQACISARFVIPRANGAQLILMLLVGAGLYASALGLMKGNNVYYLFADIYHWWVELFFVAYLTYVVARRIDSTALVKCIVLISLLLGILTLIAVVLSSLGLTTAAGHHVAAINLFRLDAGRGYPLLLLLLLFATSRAQVNLPETWGLIRLIAAVMLLIALAFTLKRALWLTFLGASMFLLLPKHYLKIALLSVPLVAAAIWGVFLFFPNFAWGVVFALADSITYNPNYTIEDTLGERIQQIVNLLPYMNNPVGYGFGAEFYTYWPGGNTYGNVHYIHNLYIYNLLQLGYAGVVLFVTAYAMLLKDLWAQIGRKTDLEWLARGTFAATLAMLVTGLTMISTHTVFNGLVFGLGLTVAIKARQRAALAKAAGRGGLRIADTGRIYS
jgi:hypothetical protein